MFSCCKIDKLFFPGSHWWCGGKIFRKLAMFDRWRRGGMWGSAACHPCRSRLLIYAQSVARVFTSSLLAHNVAKKSLNSQTNVYVLRVSSSLCLTLVSMKIIYLRKALPNSLCLMMYDASARQLQCNWHVLSCYNKCKFHVFFEKERPGSEGLGLCWQTVQSIANAYLKDLWPRWPVPPISPSWPMNAHISDLLNLNTHFNHSAHTNADCSACRCSLLAGLTVTAGSAHCCWCWPVRNAWLACFSICSSRLEHSAPKWWLI